MASPPTLRPGRCAAVVSPACGVSAFFQRASCPGRCAALVWALAGCRSDAPPTAIARPSSAGPSPATAVPAPGSAALAPPRVVFAPVWQASGTTQTFSSPRAADLTGDGVLDLVIGHGVTAVSKALEPESGPVGSVTAHDGRTGAELWRYELDREVVASAALVDLDGDAVPDVVTGGFDGRFFALNGRTGRPLWTLRPEPRFGKAGTHCFYSPQPLGDENGDGVTDLLAASGGDPTVAAGQPREPGHLLIVSGKDGRILHAAATPDAQETYTSPLVYRAGTERRIVFGTGGESLRGAVWVAGLEELRRNDLSRARRLLSSMLSKGLIAPPALADLGGDGIPDIIAPLFDGRLVAFDGVSGAIRWVREQSGCETYLTPAVGRFNRDTVPDVFAIYSVGTVPNYRQSRAVVVDGATGQVLDEWVPDGLGDGSPLAMDFDADGLDEVLYSLRDRGVGRFVLYDPQSGQSEVVLEVDGRGAATPWLGDLDADGRLDLVHASMVPPTDVPLADPFQFELNVRWTLRRLQADLPVPAAVAWGAYLGTGADGLYPPTRRPVPAGAPPSR